MSPRSRLIFATIFLFYFAVQLAFIEHPYLLSDESLYAWNTHVIRENPEMFFHSSLWEHHPPVIPLAAAQLPFAPHISLRILSILAGALSIWLTFLIGRRFVGEQIGLFAAAALSVTPAFVTYSHAGILDVPLLAAMLLATYGWWSRNEVGRGLLIIMGVLLSLLIKEKGIFLMLASLFLLFLARQLAPFATVIYSIPKKGVVLVFVVVMFFWYYFAPALFHAPLQNFYSFLSVVPFPFWLLMVFGLAHHHLKPQSAFPSFAWFIGATSVVFFISFPPDSQRFFLFALPVVYFWAGVGFVFVKRMVENRYLRFQAFPFLTLVLFLPLVFGNVIIFQSTAEAFGHYSVADWVHEHPGGIIIASFARELRYVLKEPFYPEGRVMVFPSTREKFEEVLRTANAPVRVVVGQHINPFAGEYLTDSYLLSRHFLLEKVLSGETYAWKIFYYNKTT